MRKITYDSVSSFVNKKPFSRDNTTVTINDSLNTVSFVLHGHTIAYLDEQDRLFINNHGYITNVTKERLNGILEFFCFPKITQKNWEWFIDGQPFIDNEFIDIKSYVKGG